MVACMKAYPPARLARALARALACLGLVVLVAACDQIAGIHSGILVEGDGGGDATADGGKTDAPVDGHADTSAPTDSATDSTVPNETSAPSDSSIPSEADAVPQGDAPADALGDATESGVDTGTEASADSSIPEDAPPDACNGQVCNGLCVPLNSLQNCGACGNDCTMQPNVVGPTCNGTTCGYTSCAAGYANCGTGAGCPVDLTVNGNCGSCGTTCSGADPVCVSSGTSASCGTGCTGSQMLCAGSCVDVSSNNTYCGNCVTSCSGGTVCTNGDCLCPTSAPTMCAGICVDATSNNMYCGTTCTTCTGGTSCVSSACTCPVSAPTLCGGVCTDTTSNNNACGPSCAPCPSGEVCSGTTCGCPGTSTLCGGTCVTCTGGETCNGTTCACPAGTHLCSGTCDSNDSTSSCGSSCTACPSATGTPSCNGTSCGYSACNSGYTLCSGNCTSTASDPTNCGSCGVSCLGGTCVSGACQPYVAASGSFIVAIASDGTNIVWTDSGLRGVFQVPLGGGPMVTLGSNVNGNWGEFGGIGVSGGVVAFLVGGSPPTLWTATEGVADSVEETFSLTTGSALQGFATAEGYEFIVSPSASTFDFYYCSSPSSCTIAKTVSGKAGLQMATNGNAFFWSVDTGAAPPPDGVYFATAGAPTTSSYVASYESSVNVAADSTYVYWESGTAIYQALQEMSAPTQKQLASQIPGTLTGLATDGTKVYFTNFISSASGSYVGEITISAGAPGTGAIKQLFTTGDTLGQIIYANNVIAWVDESSNTIHALSLQ
jgi:hypothetical protein